MIERIVSELGPWNWMVLGLILLGFEILVPGIFLLWIGIAALIVGTLSLMLWDTAVWSWQVQMVLFVILSLVSAWLGKRVMDRHTTDSDEPLLNQRAAQLVGRTATLEEPVENGHGRVRIGDTMWRVTGSDMPSGTRVRVISAEANVLGIEAL
ncbi:MAG: NfeD family protein [Notoacmeibacter sp.]|nr:NfeD family protein [Notoacmeibacter sp.]